MSIPQSADAIEPVILGVKDCGVLEFTVDTDAGPLQSLGTVPVSGLAPGECLKGIIANVGNNTYFAIDSMGNIYEIGIVFERNGAFGFAKKIKSISPSLLSNKFALTYNSLTGQLKLISAFSEIIQLDPKTGRSRRLRPIPAAPTQHWLPRREAKWPRTARS